MKVLPIGLALLIGSLGTTALVAATQQQAPSAAEAARRTRDQKKAQPKSKLVWTNDNIPTTPGAISVVGNAPEPAPQATAETSAENKENNQKPEAGGEGKPASAAPGAEAGKGQEQTAADELAKAKDHLATVRTDLDLLQRESDLEQQTYYGKPNFAADKEGKAKLDALAQQVEAKRQEVQEAEQQVSELEKKTPSEEKTEAPPSPPSSPTPPSPPPS